MNNERKTRWATVTHKDGSSMTGEIWGWNADQFKIDVLGVGLAFLCKDVTIKYIERPLPTLPTKPGSVIEAGNGMRFFLSHGSLYPWASSIPIDTENIHDDKSVLAYCLRHGGFTVIVEGK